jgi:hypothetical protein
MHFAMMSFLRPIDLGAELIEIRGILEALLQVDEELFWFFAMQAVQKVHPLLVRGHVVDSELLHLVFLIAQVLCELRVV